MSDLVDPVYNKLKQDAKTFIDDISPNEAPKRVDQIIDHFSSSEQLSKYAEMIGGEGYTQLTKVYTCHSWTDL